MDDLSRIPLFRGCPAADLATLAAAARWRVFGPGQTIIEAGDLTRDILFIVEGEVRIVSRSSGGHEIILNEMGPGSFFGEIAAIDGGPRSAGVVALTRARVCSVAQGPFMTFALSSQEASLTVMRLLAQMVRVKDARLMELTVLPARARLIALLLRLARPREGGGQVVTPPRPHHELAARIGARREVVSRMMSAMQRDGLVAPTRGGLVLLSPEALAAEVEAGYRAASGG